jgi:hypothetical protein
MTSLTRYLIFSRTMTWDDSSTTDFVANIKFKRAFQFLQFLLIQRIEGENIVKCSKMKRLLKNRQCSHEHESQQHNYQVFLGGSCNPTTWRHEQAIPYLESRSLSFYNPQVSDWTPDLVEIEHQAKELAPLLFFVIDHDTRALASMVEVCYLAARGRSIIVVMSPIPDKNSTKFLQRKSTTIADDDDNDYENVCQARQTLRQLLHTMNIPVFNHVRPALECAAYMLETTRRKGTNADCAIDDDRDENHGEYIDVLDRSM